MTNKTSIYQLWWLVEKWNVKDKNVDDFESRFQIPILLGLGIHFC